jgi:hypothetical protein
MRHSKAKSVYQVSGEAKDQETILRLRAKMEDYVKTDLGKNFSTTSLRWNMMENQNFSFTLDFYV